MQLIEFIQQILQGSEKQELFPRTYSSEEIKTNLMGFLPNNSNHLNQFKEFLAFVFDHSLNTAHPYFNNQLYGKVDDLSIAAEVLIEKLNSSMATFEIAPLANMMEIEFCHILFQIFKLKDTTSTNHDSWRMIMTSGGSQSNSLALMMARHRQFPLVKMNGYKGYQGFEPKIFISNQAHYSFQKAMNTQGLGQNNIILIKSDPVTRQLLVSDLIEKIESLEPHQKPMLVVSTFGTTVFGALDEVDKIDKIAKKFNIWHHIDAAWGGGGAFLKEYEKEVKTFSLADSFTWDPHKSTDLSVTSSIFATKHKELMFHTFNGGGENYLFQEFKEEDSGHFSLQCGRRQDIIKLWMQFYLRGFDELGARIATKRKNALLFSQLIQDSDEFDLLHYPQYLNVCFSTKDKSKMMQVRDRLMADKIAYINYASDQSLDFPYFRMTFGNTALKQSHVYDLVQQLESVARKS